MGAADAIHARFASSFVPSAKLSALAARLCDPKGGDVQTIITEHAEEPGPSQLAGRSPDIDKAFAGETVEAILAALAETSGEWAAKTSAALSQKSPKALKLTLAAIRNARTLSSLDQALIMEYRLTVRLFEDGEFPEGVRALLVDKDLKPKWSPSQLDGVSNDLVARYLTPLPPGDDLTFEADNQ